MLTGAIRNQVDQVWNAFWSGGVSNPLSVIEQITYFGDLSFVYLRLADGRRISCSRYNVCRTGPPDPAPGTACRIGLHPDDMLLVGD